MRENVIIYMSNGNVKIILLIVGLIKKIVLIYQIQVHLDLSNYATKSYLKKRNRR